MGNLDSKRLETFRMVAMQGSLSQAACHLHLSQPAVTAQIQQLEAALGRTLFLRSRSGMRLTEAGRTLLEAAERIHQVMGDVERSLATSPTEILGPLRMAASTTVAAYVLPDALARFRVRYPDTPLELEVGNTQQVQAWVREGRTDLGAVEGLDRAPGLRLEPLKEDRLVCIAPMEGPFGNHADLRAYPIIWREAGSGTRTIVEKALARLPQPRVPMPTDPVIGHTEAIKRAVKAGMGLGFLSWCSVEREVGRGELKLLDLPGVDIRRRFSWVVPPGGLPRGAHLFRRLVQEGV